MKNISYLTTPPLRLGKGLPTCLCPVGYNVSSVMLDLRDMVSCGEATPRFLTLGTAYLFLRRVVVP